VPSPAIEIRVADAADSGELRGRHHHEATHASPMRAGFFSVLSDIEGTAEEEFRSLRDGTIVFNPPAKMLQGDTKQIDVRISQRPTDRDPGDNLEGGGVPSLMPIKTGPVMEVDLEGGRDFDVVPENKNPVRTLPANAPYAEWVFDVTAKSYGKRTLNLQAWVLFPLRSNLNNFTSFGVLHRDVLVQVSPTYVITQALEGENSTLRWFLTGIGGIMATAAGYLGRRWFERKD
jgi:hypothetical protein